MKNRKEYIDIIKKHRVKNSNIDYLLKHPEFIRFNTPKCFYFRVLTDRMDIHWAILETLKDVTKIYFINSWGRIFDQLEYKNRIKAQRDLRKNGFEFSTNKYCPFLPTTPIYLNLSCGKKSAPYSQGNLWTSVRRTNSYKKNIDKYIKYYVKSINRSINKSA